MTANNIQGRTLLLQISDDAGSTWKDVGGISTKEFNRDNPITDVTSQSTPGNETEACYNGYSTVTLNGSGKADTRDDVDTMGYKAFSAIANSSTPSALMRLADSEETYEGTFLITSFGKTSEQNGIVEFSAALQNESAITFTQT